MPKYASIAAAMSSCLLQEASSRALRERAHRDQAKRDSGACVAVIGKPHDPPAENCSPTEDAAATWVRGASRLRPAAARAGRDRQRRPRGEERARDQHADADPEHRVELGADAHVGRHAARGVRVHDDRRASRRPRAPSRASARPLRTPTRPRTSASPAAPDGAPPGRREYCGSPLVSRSVDDVVLDARQVARRPPQPGPIPTNTGAVALAPDADGAEERVERPLGAVGVEVGALRHDRVRRRRELLRSAT